MENNFTKNDIVDQLTRRHKDLAQEKLDKSIDTVFEELSTALVCGDRVEIRGFGSLVVRKRSKGQARNPKNGEKVTVDERGSLYFRASKELIKELNVSSANDN